MRRLLKALTVSAQLLMDAVAASFAVLASLNLYFGIGTRQYRDFIANYSRTPGAYLWLLGFYVVLVLICSAIFGCYSSVWRRAGVGDLLRQIGSSLMSAGLLYAACAYKKLGIPIELVVIVALLELVLVLVIRFAPAFFAWLHVRAHIWRRGGGLERVLIYGAGDAGSVLAHRLSTLQESRRLMGFLDDNSALWGRKVVGVPVLGGHEKLAEAIRNTGAHEVIVAIPGVRRELLKETLSVCHGLRCRLKRFGTIDDVSDASLSTASITDIHLEDLLRRDSVTLDMAAVRRFLEGKTVLVTGGAGSIGSEICRQALYFGAERVIVFDFSENGLYAIGNELEKSWPRQRYELRLGSIRDRARLREVFDQYAPQVVFHAAAHKHVPMMELNPMEAVKNNVFGTVNVAAESLSHGVEKFILISTDKAVNPANVMGATKRLAELAIQIPEGGGGTEFAAVRFGNVLGSSGSVVPHFKEQIAQGGPVTVTDPAMRRYFMTIPEAVQLVFEAGAMAAGGEIFVLDMGEPVYIYDLACDMIRLSGLEPGKDIEIRFTGARPGEKLFEEINLREEQVNRTKNQKIYILKPARLDRGKLGEQLAALRQSVEQQDRPRALALIRGMVPTFCDRAGAGGDKTITA